MDDKTVNTLLAAQDCCLIAIEETEHGTDALAWANAYKILVEADLAERHAQLWGGIPPEGECAQAPGSETGG
jgi:hypothetical protein